MKANKALKRIAKIEELTSEVTRRLSKSAPHISDVLKDLKAAVARVKESVSARVSHAAKKAPKKAAVKKATVKAQNAKAAKSGVRVKRTVKKAAGKRTAPAPVLPAETAVQELSAGN